MSANTVLKGSREKNIFHVAKVILTGNPSQMASSLAFSADSLRELSSIFPLKASNKCSNGGNRDNNASGIGESSYLG